MSTSDSTDLSLLDSWANEAVVQFLRETKVFVQKTTIALTAGQAEYELDTDILSFETIYVEPASGGQSRLLEALDGKGLTHLQLLQGGGQDVMYYSVAGHNLLEVHPVPVSSSDVLHIRYVPRPTSALAATADSPAATAYGGIPEEYHTLLEAYVKWKACSAEEHKPSENGLNFQAEWERGIARVKTEINRRSGVIGARNVWGRRGRGRFAVTPGTDLG